MTTLYNGVLSLTKVEKNKNQKYQPKPNYVIEFEKPKLIRSNNELPYQSYINTYTTTNIIHELEF
jgi:hypothetical protein